MQTELSKLMKLIAGNSGKQHDLEQEFLKLQAEFQKKMQAAIEAAILPQRKPPCAVQNPSIFGKAEPQPCSPSPKAEPAIQKRAIFGIGFRKFKTEDGSWLIKDSDGRYLALLIPDARIADAMIAGLEAAV